VAPSGGFNQSVAFACIGAPAQSTCAVSPNTVALNGSTAATVSVTVTTAAASMLVYEHPVSDPPPTTIYRLLVPILGLLALVLLASLNGRSWEQRPRLAYGVALLLLLCAGVTLSACGGGGGSSGGGGGNAGTPTGTYTLVVSATFTSGSTTLTHSADLTLVVQ
jgi:peptidoglycan/LPS O-acetylase OafA/YrhL